MCSRCNYNELIRAAGLEATPNRLRVLEIIGGNDYPLTATDVFTAASRTHRINRVTVYRILDLLVENQIIDRLSASSRASYYGMAPNKHHAPHPHFYCTSCGHMDCMTPEGFDFDLDGFTRNFTGKIARIEIRVDGLCKNCLKNKQSANQQP